jgi:3'-phosphoadenosine 5'-phosphosulfate sulfotransferase (PAPS reductase)/FAD synthetase
MTPQETKLQAWELAQRQSWPLEAKIIHTQQKVREFYDAMDGQVFVSFSGGKDSTVLLDIVRRLYPEVEAVFVNTGLEYPEIVKFVRTVENVKWLRPGMPFKKVIQTYGYPVVSKKVARQIRYLKHPNERNSNSRKLYLEGVNRKGETVKSYRLSDKWRYLVDAPFEISEQCCVVMKERPLTKYQRSSDKFPIIGTMASDSRQRRGIYLRTGCNILEGSPISKPLSIWTEADVWAYIKQFGVPYCPIYDQGTTRTGCIFCAFGAHLEASPNRFQRMATAHPRLYHYCIHDLEMGKVLDYIKVDYQQRNLDQMNGHEEKG